MQLTVYKASAGSGKTYTLTREYLKQALLHADNPYLFRSILAVTFTNKATEEMKKRIVNTLNELAQGANKKLSQELLKDNLTISEHDLQHRAYKARTAILHDYSHFAVSTIDTFFQKVLQAFVREAGLRPGFSLELDTDRLLHEAVDKLMLSTSADQPLRKWLFSVIENRIEDRGSWDIRPLLLTMGREVFSEQFRRFGSEFHQKIQDKAFMDAYLRQLYTIYDSFNEKLKGIGVNAISIIQKAGLTTDDFKNKKSGFINHFYKIAKGIFEEPKTRVYDALQSFDGWVTKGAKRTAEVESAYPQLLPLLTDAVNYWNENSRQYLTALAVLRKFGELGVLADIAKNVSDIAGDENLMPISDSVHLLSTLIGESDTPFVYERIGNRYRTFMIDEFQDTSVSQWNNFRPLLHNSLAENHFNMVVGDVKQSIYRWRSGDWRILAYQLAHDFAMFGLDEQNLSTNWRSKATIVAFNNAIFNRLSVYLQQLFNNSLEENKAQLSVPDKALLESIIPTAYADAEQAQSPNTAIGEGYVEINIIDSEEEEKSTEKVLNELPLLIAELQDRGYRPHDIAILVRRGKDGQLIANSLLTYKKTAGDSQYCFDVISQDSLFIANASAVQIVIAALRIAINPTDAINAAFLQHELLKHNTNGKSLHETFAIPLPNDEQEFINKLSNRSLGEAFELLVQHYKLNEHIDELPFLQELHDVINTFSNRKLSDIASFLNWWDDKGRESTLSAGENRQAISIMTIHKSKGLQFPVVIVPFVNWNLEPRTNSTIWVSPQNAPFNNLPYLPVAYSNDLPDTDFNADYLSEKVQSFIDNINLLYVAFTRAENELYITIPKPKKELSKLSLSAVLPEFLRQYTGASDTLDFGALQGLSQEDGKQIIFGAKQPHLHKTEERQGLVLQQYPSSVFNHKLRLKYESDDYFTDDSASPMQRRNYGILMHRVFAGITTANEYPDAISRLYEDGVIDKDDTDILTKKIQQALQHPIAAQWFDGSWKVKAETGLLLPTSGNNIYETQRPDRVMIRPDETLVIDYKFGLIEKKQYEKQLANYMNLLKQMNYPAVKGYIWYVDLEKVIEVV